MRAQRHSLWLLGITFVFLFISGHNTNVKLGFNKVETNGSADTTQATIQFQLFYF